MSRFVQVGRVEDVPPGARLHHEFEEDTVIVLNVGGEFYCIADLCTHDGGPLADGELHDHQIECPRHGACFDVRTGRVTRLPATEPIPTYRVRIEDGAIWVEEPELW
ncbi:non-heme iron oxygenase ferredoxin subunit [Promineifilum sp.]|uniref:non-heme iron oxygenase ferredoxin subunit n=1 Tax=Promineifilum sp. TaxID=2664178 RepID=UPI0035AFCC07